MWLLYWRLVGARIRAQMQYKTSFWLELGGFALVTGLEFTTTLILFTRFPSIGGWSLFEVAFLYGLSSTALGIAEMVGRGFDAPFEVMMQRGAFDGVLIRPLGSFFQILASEFQLRRLGRTFQGLTVLMYALAHLSIEWTLGKAWLVPASVAAGVLIYLGLIVISATICFWTIKTPEVVNIFTFGGDFLVSYPMSIYNQWIRSVFMFAIPLALCNYPTALLLLGRSDSYGLPSSLAWFAPFIAATFFVGAYSFWRYGVTRYQSTGS